MPQLIAPINPYDYNSDDDDDDDASFPENTVPGAEA